MSADYADDRAGMMRVHIAEDRARLASARYTRTALRDWAQTHDVQILASLNKRDFAWYMAQNGLIDGDGNLRDGFPDAAVAR